MEIKKMTEAAILTAIFVVTSVTAISTGISYLGYLDFIIPIITTLIYLRCKFKYTLLSSISSVIITTLFIGDIASGIYMSQSIMIGFICGVFIEKEETIIDDLFYCSICACIILVIVDINFSKIIGVSLLNELQYFVNNLMFLKEELKNGLYYVLIISLPIGTIFINYIVALIIGKKLNLLIGTSNKKFLVIGSVKKYSNLICCSKKIINNGIIYLIIIYILHSTVNLDKFNYINIILNSIKYITIYFLLQDSYKYINKLIFKLIKSRVCLILIQLTILYMLLNSFLKISIILIGISFIIDKILNLREKQINYLNSILI